MPEPERDHTDEPHEPRRDRGADANGNNALHAGRAGRSPSRWQIVLVATAAAIALIGAGLTVYAWTLPDQAVAMDPSAPLANSLAPGQADGAVGAAPAQADEPFLEAYAPAIFRLGFSFVVGFVIAFALRAFLRLALILAGVVLLALFGLQYAGVVDIDWNAIGNQFNDVGAYLASQFDTARDFITGSLPSAGAALAGLVIGFRR